MLPPPTGLPYLIPGCDQPAPLTPTVPFAPAIQRRRPVTLYSIRSIVSGHRWILPAHDCGVYIGASDAAAIQLPRPHRHVSALHAELLNRGGHWELRANSQNYVWYHGAPVDRLPLRPGDRFYVADVGLLALNETMHRAAYLFSATLGMAEPERVSVLLEAAATETAMAIVLEGEFGDWAPKFAATVHDLIQDPGGRLVRFGRDRDPDVGQCARQLAEHGALTIYVGDGQCTVTRFGELMAAIASPAPRLDPSRLRFVLHNPTERMRQAMPAWLRNRTITCPIVPVIERAAELVDAARWIARFVGSRELDDVDAAWIEAPLRDDPVRTPTDLWKRAMSILRHVRNGTLEEMVESLRVPRDFV